MKMNHLFTTKSNERNFSGAKKLLILLSAFAINAYATNDVASQQLSVSSDNTYYTDGGEMVYARNVEINQGALEIDGDNAVSTRSVYTVVGSPATFEQSRSGNNIQGSANEITYYKNSGRLSLVGDARIGVGNEQLASDIIVYNVSTNAATVVEVEED